jgi:hypothetical protein
MNDDDGDLLALEARRRVCSSLEMIGTRSIGIFLLASDFLLCPC